MTWRELRDRFLLVHKCGGCHQILPTEQTWDALCPSCRLRWNRAKTEDCPRCFSSALECVCMPKKLSATGMLCLRKLFFYSAERDRQPQNQMIYRLKRVPNRRWACFIAEELTPALEQELSALGLRDSREEAVLVAVPRGRKGRGTYGFDQAELIGEALCRQVGLRQVYPLKRGIGGKEQKRMAGDKRARNVSRSLRLADPSAVRGKTVVLLDDVVTTGSSMAACAVLLRQAGAKAVIGLCIAQAR